MPRAFENKNLVDWVSSALAPVHCVLFCLCLLRLEATENVSLCRHLSTVISTLPFLK